MRVLEPARCLTVCTIPLVLLCAALSVPAAAGPSFDERIAAQRAIEEVYWRHRIWPKENPGPKPELSAVLSDEAISARVESYLRMSNALAALWKHPVTGEQLRAEVQRMSRATRDPQLLRELYAALGNDARLIAETLGRQTLVERLIHSWFSIDGRIHGQTQRRAQHALSGLRDVGHMSGLGDAYAVTSYELLTPGDEPKAADASSRAIRLEADEWSAWSSQVARWFGVNDVKTIPLGTPSSLIVEPNRFLAVALLTQGPGRMTVASVTWPKQPFEEWWGTASADFDLEVSSDVGSMALPKTAENGCVDDTWMAPSPAFAPPTNNGSVAVWTGTELMVWGGAGSASPGGRYSPVTDTWLPISTGPNVPSWRKGHAGVWTGTEMIIWGGQPDTGAPLNTGGRYDPAMDTWTPTSTGANVPASRTGHTAVWTGTEMIVWGGSTSNTGGRYDPSTDTWTPTSTGANVPASRTGHTAVWTGTEMIVWGGSASGGTKLNTGGRYDPSTDTWTPTSTGANVPASRTGHTAVWTGTEMIVWGGQGTSSPPFPPFGTLNSGSRYNPSTDTWTFTSIGANVPTERQQHTAVWTGTEMMIWAGTQSSSAVEGGGRYNPLTNAWSPLTSYTTYTVAPRGSGAAAVWTGTEMLVWGGSPPFGERYDPSNGIWIPMWPYALTSNRAGHTAVWTGAEMIVWGGGNEPAEIFLATGGRYSPATDSWHATWDGPGTPSKRTGHAAVWTGTEMIVWGGFAGDVNNIKLDTGARYNPTTNSWAATSTGANLPVGRQWPSAVWTGSEMIVWGGWGKSSYPSGGGRYNPATDSWAPVAGGPNEPVGRQWHGAAWTGNEMIVWGGLGVPSGGQAQALNTGGRYDPSSDAWTPTSNAAGVPAPRYRSSTVWTGSEMIVWGGNANAVSSLNSGGRYSPSTDSWVPTSQAGAPGTRNRHTAVWTGTQMVVWGGNASGTSGLNTGGRYDPSNDTWTATSTGANLPSQRFDHTAVWTGDQMVVWGGSSTSATGGRYCASGCAAATVYGDSDGDGFGDAAHAVISYCSVPAGYVANSSDCDDGDATTYAGAVEINDGQDNQCPGDAGYGTIDELSGATFCDPGDKNEYCWPAQAGATEYQVARASKADFTQDCTPFANTAQLFIVDTESVPVGEVRFYLVRPRQPNPGSWGLDSSGQERSVPCAP